MSKKACDFSSEILEGFRNFYINLRRGKLFIKHIRMSSVPSSLVFDNPCFAVKQYLVSYFCYPRLVSYTSSILIICTLLVIREASIEDIRALGEGEG